jgi:hypothetical protein
MAKTAAEFAGVAAGDIAPPQDPLVGVRVLKKGDGKISTGRHDPRGGDELYERDETFTVASSIALELEELGYVEIDRDPLDHDGDGRKGGSVKKLGPAGAVEGAA